MCQKCNCSNIYQIHFEIYQNYLNNKYKIDYINSDFYQRKEYDLLLQKIQFSLITITKYGTYLNKKTILDSYYKEKNLKLKQVLFYAQSGNFWNMSKFQYVLIL